MSEQISVHILDSTLRDGSHALSHQFTAEQVARVARGLDQAGIEMIEVSHGDGLGGSTMTYGFSKQSELELLEAASSVIERGKLAVLLLPGIGTYMLTEGTSSDGNRVLPFRSALIGAVHETPEAGTGRPPLLVQPLALTYLRLNGLPMGRQHRPVVAWHGDLDMGPHVWRLLTSGTIDAEIAFGEPIPLPAARERKSVAKRAEAAVRAKAQLLMSGRATA
jgi:hypothetical protein